MLVLQEQFYSTVFQITPEEIGKEIVPDKFELNCWNSR